MSSTVRPKIRVAIIGGGIGGLMLAVALSKLQVTKFMDIDVYESTAKLSQIGAGIMLWPRGWEIVKGFGLEESLAQKMSPDQELPSPDQIKRTFTIRRSDMKDGHPIVEVMMPGGSIAFHRADVQEVLLSHVSPSIKMHLSHRLVDFTELENGEVELEFRNGKKAICDVMIASDGINSVVRKILLTRKNNWTEEEAAKFSQPLWTGSICYRSTLDAESIRQEAPNLRALTSPMMYIGKGRHIVAYPIAKGTLINAVPFITEYDKEGSYVEGPVLTEGSTDNVASHFEGWEDDVEVLLKHITKPSRWAIQTVAPLETYLSKSRKIIMIGDAAHGAPPHLGNGASQAIEDVYILAHILAKGLNDGDVKKIPKVAGVYDAVRQPFGNFAAAATNKLGHLLDLHAPGFENIRDGESVSNDKISELAKSIEHLWRWTAESAKPELNKALAML